MTPPPLAPAARRPLSVLVVNPDVPPRDRDSGSLRLSRLLELLAADGHRVTLVARCGVGQEAAAAELRELGVEVHEADPERCGFPVGAPPLDLRALLARVRPDVAWLSFYDTAEVYLPLLRRLAPGARIAIDTVDVHSLREQRAAELSGSAADAAAAGRTRAREQAVYGAADALVAVSEDDARALRELAPAVPVSVVSNVHEPLPAGPPLQGRAGVVFVGNFRHTPNVDASLYLCRSIWPAVRAAVPDARLRLVGTAPPPAVQALAAPDVEVTGWVPDTAPYLEAARVSVAPLRYGAGVKGKIGEALAHGLPVVTTPVGAEGMELVPGRDVLVGATPGELAEAVVRLHADDALWHRLAAAGRAALACRLSPEVARDALRGLLSALVPVTFVVARETRSAGALADVLRGYLGAFGQEDPVSLVVPHAPDERPHELYGRLLEAIRALGRDPERIPDVAVAQWEPGAAAPAAAILVGGAGAGAALAVDGDPAAWRLAAGARALEAQARSAART